MMGVNGEWSVVLVFKDPDDNRLTNKDRHVCTATNQITCTHTSYITSSVVADLYLSGDDELVLLLHHTGTGTSMESSLAAMGSLDILRSFLRKDPTWGRCHVFRSYFCTIFTIVRLNIIVTCIYFYRTTLVAIHSSVFNCGT